MEISIPPYEYEKRRDAFGHQTNFGDTQPGIINSIESDPRCSTEWFQLIEKTVDLDCIPKMARHMVNTRQHKTFQKGTSHQDGAWHQDNKKMDSSDRDKLRKRFKKEDAFVTGLPYITAKANENIRQNNVIDLYARYFEEEDMDVHASEPPSTKTAAVFRDPNDVTREANCISWHPEGPNKLAVAYSSLQFQQMPTDMPMTSYIWDVNSPNAPDQALIPNSPLVSVEYNPKSSDHIAGGSYNGLVSFWDLRKGEVPFAVIDKAHHDPVYDIKWIQSRTGNECVSVSTDGRMLWWDVRNIKAGFVDSMLMKEEKTTYGGTSMAYNSTAGATKYLVGTEQGRVLLCDRKAKKDAESTKSRKLFGKPGAKHHGPIYSIERNPLHHKYFLTVGDWTARIWAEELLKTPIMNTRYETSKLTGACWSPTRPGVYFTTKVDGTLDVWDIYYKQNDPTFSTKVTDSPLTSIKVEKTHGSLVAIGSKDGTCTVLQISSGLYQPHADEKNQMLAMFERETKREKNLDMRANNRRREAKERSKPKPPAFDPFADEPPELRAKLDKVEASFFEKLQLNRDGSSSAPAKEAEPAAEAGEAEASAEKQPEVPGPA